MATGICADLPAARRRRRHAARASPGADSGVGRVAVASFVPGVGLGSASISTGRVLAGTRNTVAWAALGHATTAREIAVAYCRRRWQFGKPLVSFQIVQDRLVKVLAEVRYAAVLPAARPSHRGRPARGRYRHSSPYFPKGTNLNGWTAEQLDSIAAELNDRPRPDLRDRTPQQAMQRWARQRAPR
jgi:alkylation response protein AidB-like acyl-CoA dehydrogenase